MITVSNNNPAWRNCYTAALFQDDASKIPTLIERAESEIVARARDLFDAPGDNMREMRALDNALHMLEVLKKCVNPPQRVDQNSAADESQTC